MRRRTALEIEAQDNVAPCPPPSFGARNVYSASTGPESEAIRENGSEHVPCQKGPKTGLSRASRAREKTDLERYRGSVSEQDVQGVIVTALEWLGYTVLVTSRRRKRCEFCGEFSRRSDGVSKGLADLMVRHPTYPPYAWLALEVKGPRTPVSPEQQQFSDDGAVAVVRSVEDAQNAICRFEERVRG